MRPEEVPPAESINNPGEHMRPQLSGTSYLPVFRAQVFPYPPTC